MEDIRRDIARYYNVLATRTNDIDFYVSHIHPEDRTVLELGCGTGRVLVPLSQHCDFIVGVDHSPAMLEFCQEKLHQQRILPHQAELLCEDITALGLQREFGLIIAPFRVFQNLETDEQVDALFRGIQLHLAPHGACILNVFKPNASAEALLETWRNPDEIFAWEKPLDAGVLKHYYRKQEIKTAPLVLYPELIYRYYENEALVNEASAVVPMRVYYADEFQEVIQSHGFTIAETWGGYRGEEYGAGPELVIKFI